MFRQGKDLTQVVLYSVINRLCSIVIVCSRLNRLNLLQKLFLINYKSRFIEEYLCYL